MGHGLTAVLLVLAVGAGPEPPAKVNERTSLPDRCLGQRMQPLLLLSRADVRADVGLDADQAEKVDKAILDLVARAAAALKLGGPAGVEAKREVDSEAQRWLEANLTEAQFRRLVQVDLQWEGLSSVISRPVVSDLLELRRDQREKIQQALALRNKQRPPRAFNRAVERQFALTATKILDARQRRLWSDMVGATFIPRLEEPIPAPASPAP